MKVDKRMMQLTFSVTCFKPLSLPLDSDAPGRKALSMVVSIEVRISREKFTYYPN